MYKTNPWAIISTILITAVVVGGIAYWYTSPQKETPTPEASQTQEEIENTTTTQEQQNTPSEQIQQETPKDQVVQTQVGTEDIRNAFSTKYPSRDYSNYTITIENSYKNEYVEGGVGAPEGGGAHYWAAKVNGEWVIVKEAQDSVPCSVFEPYDFPQEIIGNDCY